MNGREWILLENFSFHRKMIFLLFALLLIRLITHEKIETFSLSHINVFRTLKHIERARFLRNIVIKKFRKITQENLRARPSHYLPPK